MTLHIKDIKASPHAVLLSFDTEPTLEQLKTLVDNARLYQDGVEPVDLETPRNSDLVTELKTARLRPAHRIDGQVRLAFSANAGVDNSEPLSAEVSPPAGDLVLDAARASHAVEDAVSYALLTEDVGDLRPTSPSPGGRPGGGGPAQMVGQALRDVLGWKPRENDPKGFTGALMASFVGREVEGHTEWTWQPRTYAVQTDAGGGISGAQASLFTRARDMLDKVTPLLDGLYPLDPEADESDIAAVKAVIGRQLEELVGELGVPGGPAVSRVDDYFDLLLADSHGGYHDGTRVRTPDPDDVQGTLGRLRDLLGLSFEDDLVNKIEDEQDQTNFRVLSDHVTSLAQTWLNNRHFFEFDAPNPFLGTRLVPLSRQLSVIAESVDEVCFTLDSVFVGADERQTLRVDLGQRGKPMYLADFLRWIRNFVTAEAPIYMQDGGKFGIGNSLVHFAEKLHAMTHALLAPGRNKGLPQGFHSARVRRSLQSLAKELGELVRLAKSLARDVSIEPPPAQLQALVEAPRLVLIPGQPQFDRNGQAEVLLLNLGASELQVTGSFSAGGFAFVFDQAQTKLTLRPGTGEHVQLGVTDTGAQAEAELRFKATHASGPLPVAEASAMLTWNGMPASPAGPASPATPAKKGR